MPIVKPDQLVALQQNPEGIRNVSSRLGGVNMKLWMSTDKFL